MTHSDRENLYHIQISRDQGGCSNIRFESSRQKWGWLSTGWLSPHAMFILILLHLTTSGFFFDRAKKTQGQKNSKLKEKTQNSRKKLKTQGKNSMSWRIAPILTSQVVLKKRLVKPFSKSNISWNEKYPSINNTRSTKQQKTVFWLAVWILH